MLGTNALDEMSGAGHRETKTKVLSDRYMPSEQ